MAGVIEPTPDEYVRNALDFALANYTHGLTAQESDVSFVVDDTRRRKRDGELPKEFPT